MTQDLGQTTQVGRSESNTGSASYAIPWSSTTLLPSRRNIENLKLSTSGNISEAADTLRSAVNSEDFPVCLLRALERNLSPEAVNTLKLNEDQSVLAQLKEIALVTLNNAEQSFYRQFESGRLKASETILALVFNPPKLSKEAFAQFFDSKQIDTCDRQALLGAIKKSFIEAVGTVLVTSQQLVRNSPSQRNFLHLLDLNLSFFPKPAELSAQVSAGSGKEARDNLGLALGSQISKQGRFLLDISRSAKLQDPIKLREFLIAIDQMEGLPLSDMSDGMKNTNILRLKRAVVGLLKRYPNENVGEAHLKTVKVLQDLASRADIVFHAYKHDNLSAVVDTIFAACLSGKVNLSMASCPDYSGTYSTDLVTGRSVKSYDFNSLGSGVGSVAERGLAFAKAWYEVLTQNGINVSVTHFEGTFEIAEGFKSRVEGNSLTYQEAFGKLDLSGQAVKKMFEEHGIGPVFHRMTHEVIKDSEFTTRKIEIARKLYEKIDSSHTEYDKEFADFVFTTLNSRKDLYAEWYPVQPNESDTDYQNRLAGTIVLQNIAEYLLLGEILIKNPEHDKGCGTLVLAYDSPKMGEVYARNNMPVISGQGRNTADYVGA